MSKKQRRKRYRTEKDHQNQEPYNSRNFSPESMEITVDQKVYQITLKQNEKTHNWEASYQGINLTGNSQFNAINRLKSRIRELESKRILDPSDPKDLEEIIKRVITLVEPLTPEYLCNLTQQSL